MLRRRIADLGAAVLLTPPVACSGLLGKHQYRYALKVVVDTPLGYRSGQSIIEAVAWEGGGAVRSSVHGEAVVIKLPNGVTLFALLKGVDGLPGAYASAAYAHVLPTAIIDNADWRVPFDAIRAQRASAEVPLKHYPKLVYFENLADPRSVQLANPSRSSELVWPGYRIKSIRVEITDDRLVSSISNVIPWVNHLDRNKPLLYPHGLSEYSLATTTARSEFIGE